MTGDSEVTIEFKGRHDHITERMQAHAARKLARLARFQDRLTRIEVVADHVHKNPEVELIVHQRKGAPLICKDRGTSFSATIDLLVDKMEAQLRKQKDKRRDHKVPNGKEVRSGAKPSARGRTKRETPDEEETYEQAVRRTLRG